MNAFVLAGGLGTRLKPRFGDLPKALAPVGGRPFLAKPLEWLASHGIREVVMCVGYGATQLRETLGDGSAFGVRLAWSEEDHPLGTGGALRHAAVHVRGPALVLNGDTLAECDPWALERARWEAGSLGAVALFEVPDTRSRGRVECREDGHIARFVEKDDSFSGPAWVNGGVYAFSSRLWRHLPAGASSLERDVLPSLATEGRITGMKASGTFYDIGTPEEWARAESRFAS